MGTLMSGVDVGERRKLGWTRKALEEAVQLGLLDPEARYEILDGELYEKMGQNWPHAFAIVALIEAFRSIDPETAYVSAQQPILVDGGMPEPDISIVSGRFRSRTDHPAGRELLLIVEVSNTSFALDQTIKARTYARSEVPVYWIIDLNRRRVEVHSRPEDGRYSETRIFEIGDSIPPAFPGAPTIYVVDLISNPTDER